MNSLILYSSDFIDSSLVRIGAARAETIWREYRKLVGQEIRIAVFGGERGAAVVRYVGPEEILLDVARLEPSLPLRPIDLIVGLSRPQTVKKVIQLAVMTGVRSLRLVATELGEKSYSTSHLLDDDVLRGEVIKALEQTGEGFAPCISVHRSFVHFCRNYESESPRHVGGLRVLAHPAGDSLGALELVATSVEATLAVGPEPGWSAREISIFTEMGFAHVGLGPRVVRVEVALGLLLGQLQALSQL